MRNRKTNKNIPLNQELEWPLKNPTFSKIRYILFSNYNCYLTNFDK